MNILQRISELRAVEEKATAGPWHKGRTPPKRIDSTELSADTMSPSQPVCAVAPGKQNMLYTDAPGGSFPASDLDFISTSRNTFLALLDALEESVRALEYYNGAPWAAYVSGTNYGEKAEDALASIAKHLTP